MSEHRPVKKWEAWCGEIWEPTLINCRQCGLVGYNERTDRCIQCCIQKATDKAKNQQQKQ